MSFRPLAGITVFRTTQSANYQTLTFPVSVPWRGLRSFGRVDRRCPRMGQGSFPSPGGDYGLSDFTIRTTRVRLRVSFRPLAGITVFRTLGGRRQLPRVVRSFRPLAGITVFRTAFCATTTCTGF